MIQFSGRFLPRGILVKDLLFRRIADGRLYQVVAETATVECGGRYVSTFKLRPLHPRPVLMVGAELGWDVLTGSPSRYYYDQPEIDEVNVYGQDGLAGLFTVHGVMPTFLQLTRLQVWRGGRRVA